METWKYVIVIFSVENMDANFCGGIRYNFMVSPKSTWSPVVLTQTILKTMVTGDVDTNWGRVEAVWSLVSQGET